MNWNQQKPAPKYMLEYSKNDQRNRQNNIGSKVLKSDPARLHHIHYSHARGDAVWLFLYLLYVYDSYCISWSCEPSPTILNHQYYGIVFGCNSETVTQNCYPLASYGDCHV